MNHPQLEQVDRTHVIWEGRRLLYFGGCDYHRLSSHPLIIRAVEESVRRDGLNPAASRITTGNHPAYALLETRMKDFFGTEAAVLTQSGYSANLILAQAFAGRFSAVLLDERAHSSLRDAVTLLGIPCIRFTHRNGVDLKLKRAALGEGAVAILTDGVFWFDGSSAPITEYAQFMKSNDWLWVDDAHGVGVSGRSGRGSLESAGLMAGGHIVRTTSLSKAVGSAGGAILGSEEIVAEVWSHSAMFRGGTPLPVPWVQAANKSLELLSSEGIVLRNQLMVNAQTIRSRAHFIQGEGPILTMFPMSSDSESIKHLFLEHGIYPAVINYEGTEIVRAVISSLHSVSELNRLANCFHELSILPARI